MIWILIAVYLLGVVGGAQWNVDANGPMKSFSRREWVTFTICAVLWPVIVVVFIAQDIFTTIRERF